MELGDEELGAVGEQQADAVSAGHAERRERCATGIAQAIELTVREPRAFEEQRCARGTIASGVREVLDERSIGIRFERWGNAGIVVWKPGRGRRHRTADYNGALRRYIPAAGASSISRSAFWPCRRFSA
jgi:hypothetical protein